MVEFWGNVSPTDTLLWFQRVCCVGSDNSGRYDYKSQPSMCRWNLETLGKSLASVLPLKDSEPALGEFDAIYKDEVYTI